MAFTFPSYRAPDFSAPRFQRAPDAALAVVEQDGVAPEGFHSTSMYPEYFKLGGVWRLAEDSRMDCSVVLRADGSLAVVENRNLRRGERVILGRTERGEEGTPSSGSDFIRNESMFIIHEKQNGKTFP